MKKIGVLALQGAFIEHINILQNLNVEAIEIRLPKQLANIDGLIIPGGESTTMGKLIVDYHLLTPLQEFGKKHPIWGTCAGAILLSKDAQRDQPLLNLMDITVQRNAFGRQVDSFQSDIKIESLPDNHIPFPCVFIRAPIIDSISSDTQLIASLDDGRIVAAKQGHLLATSFHPELTQDTRFHQFFISMI